MWTGADAIKIGLVDTLGGLDLALRIAAEKAGVEKYIVKDYPAEKDVWEQLSDMLGESDSDDIDLLAKVRLARKWRAESGKHRMLTQLEQDLQYVAESEGVQARLPFVVVGD